MSQRHVTTLSVTTLCHNLVCHTLDHKPYSFRVTLFVSLRLSIGYELLMFFVYDAFGCVLRILVIRLTLFLLIHPLMGYSISLHSTAHSIELFILNPSINLCLCDHSIVSPFWNHSIASDIMPATTRSMSKRMIVSDRNQSSDTLVHCDETFIDESVLSSSSLDTGPCHSVISNFGTFKISNFVVHIFP